MKHSKFIVLLLGSIVSILSLSAQSKKELKLISYNVYWGMKQDSTVNKSEFTKWIREQDPDILALQEMNGFTQENSEFAPKGSNPNNLQTLAASYGHPYVFIVKEPAANGSISFPVAITSKYPIVNVQRVVDNLVHGLLLVEIEGFHFAITHFHPFSSEKRGNEIDLVLATINSNPKDWKWLFMGDLNSVSPLDKEEYDNGLLLNNIREDMKKRPQNLNLRNNELDYSVQEKILNDGFIDAFKKYHPKFEASAPTKLFYDQSNYPLRYDYIYVSKNMDASLVSCNLIKDSFTDIYSDHYPVQLIFKK